MKTKTVFKCQQDPETESITLNIHKDELIVEARNTGRDAAQPYELVLVSLRPGDARKLAETLLEAFPYPKKKKRKS